MVAKTVILLIYQIITSILLHLSIRIYAKVILQSSYSVLAKLDLLSRGSSLFLEI